ncbi:MAG: adenylosuccinate lyase, partial [Actinomycetota bacterium]
RESKTHSLLDAIAADSRIPLDKSALEELIKNPIEFIGDATSQTERVVARIGAAVKPFPAALTYRPGAIR